jgi:DNA-binding NtrC family response regulator
VTTESRPAGPRILVIDDEPGITAMLAIVFEKEGYAVTTARSCAEGMKLVEETSPDLVLTDLRMPDGTGFDVLRKTRETSLETPVVMITAYTSTKTAIEALKAGAYDYVSKPFDVEELKHVVGKALERKRLADENVELRARIEERPALGTLIGVSRRMRGVFDMIERIGRTTSTVLITGESGTGKELIARAIHRSSPRATRPFVSINCGALPESLLESELFGHERGAFTGAVRDKKGLFQEAEGGTLFLDEIGETSVTMQVKLLRALQERLVRRVGGNLEEPVDVRIICATNKDLARKVAEKSFREDFYYRIAVIPLPIPPCASGARTSPCWCGISCRKARANWGWRRRGCRRPR